MGVWDSYTTGLWNEMLSNTYRTKNEGTSSSKKKAKEKDFRWKKVQGNLFEWDLFVNKVKSSGLRKYNRVWGFPFILNLGEDIIFDIDGSESTRRSIHGDIYCDKIPDLLEIFLKRKDGTEFLVHYLRDPYQYFEKDIQQAEPTKLLISAPQFRYPDAIEFRSYVAHLQISEFTHEMDSRIVKKRALIELPDSEYITVEEREEVQGVSINHSEFWGNSIVSNSSLSGVGWDDYIPVDESMP